MDMFIYITLVSMLVPARGVDCPYQVCDCYDDTIACDYNDLKTLPELQAVNITMSLSLSLTSNQLTRIQIGALPPRLYKIDFQMNPITAIDQAAFDASAATLTDLLFSQARFRELPRALLNLNALKHLTIGDMQITAWHDDVLQHIGLTLQTLILSNVGLTTWPTWIQFLPHIGTLELSGMSFQVPDDAFNNQANTLFSLNFENCRLSEIPNAVSRLNVLRYLVLDSNNISNLTGLVKSTTLSILSLNNNIISDLAGLPNSVTLSTVNLENNNISDAGELSQALRPCAQSLTFLQLTRNKLTSMPDLSGMVKLDTLYLSENAISITGTGKVPASLSLLALDNNKLPSLYSFMQTGVNLSSLLLHSNSIKDIQGVDIPVSVSHLDVTNNFITELTDTSFPHNSRLNYLTMDSNPISKISSLAFDNVRRLSYLSMTNTELTRLPLSLSVLTNLNSVDLSQNAYLICTCLEKSLRQWFLIHQFEINGDCGITTIENFLRVLSVDCPD